MSKIDFMLLAIVVLLTFFGLLMVFDASSFIAYRDFADKYHYIRDQSTWMILGFIAMSIFVFFDYHKLYLFALPILIFAIFLLLLVFIPGVGVFALGAKRWINMRFFILQPAELVKLSLAIYLSAWFSNKEKKRFGAFSLLIGLVLGLIMLEPDMGTAGIVLSEALLVYFLSGGSIMHFFLAVPVIGLLAALLAVFEPYRAKRIVAFLNVDQSLQTVDQSLQTSSYHVRQILIALGMGGITGVGIGNSLQKYAYLPENATDSIFAIIAEEFGFVGSVILIFAFMFLVWRGFLVAARAKDAFGRLLAGSITTFLAVQIIINLGAQTALFPLTGVPLPFISYGGSALVVDLCSIGILLNISKQAHG